MKSNNFIKQEEDTGEITFLMKGADVVMTTIVQYNDWLEEEVGYKGDNFDDKTRQQHVLLQELL